MTPGLGSRLTGKLLREFGSPEDVFRASLTELEACHLPSAPARAIQSKHAFKDAEKELAEVRKLGCRLLNWDETEYPRGCLKFTIRRPFCTCVATQASSTGTPFRWWARAAQRPTASK